MFSKATELAPVKLKMPKNQGLIWIDVMENSMIKEIYQVRVEKRCQKYQKPLMN